MSVHCPRGPVAIGTRAKQCIMGDVNHMVGETAYLMTSRKQWGEKETIASTHLSKTWLQRSLIPARPHLLDFPPFPSSNQTFRPWLLREFEDLKHNEQEWEENCRELERGKQVRDCDPQKPLVKKSSISKHPIPIRSPEIAQGVGGVLYSWLECPELR